jgi:hypothetical protein
MHDRLFGGKSRMPGLARIRLIVKPLFMPDQRLQRKSPGIVRLLRLT